MVTYVFDASAVLRYLDAEAGGQRVSQILKSLLRGDCRVLISAVQWGEIAGRIVKTHGDAPCNAALSRLAGIGIEVVPASAERAVRSAFIKARRKIPYADAFVVEIAMDEPNCLLVTSDFDLKPAAHDIKVEFLPKKP